MTLADARDFIRYAPPATDTTGGPDGWELDGDGAQICGQCAGRIIGRGFGSAMRHSHPLYDAVRCQLCEPDFTLANDPPAHIPQRFESQHVTRQRKLIDGMECLPGQLDLF